MQKNNLMEIGKIVRAHGIKGAVKILSYLNDVNFSIFEDVFIGESMLPAKFTKVLPLNNNAYSIMIDVIKDIDETAKYLNQSVYIERNHYEELDDVVFLDDFAGKEVVDEKGDKIGIVLEVNNYGANDVLDIKCGFVTYAIPFIDEIVTFDEERDVLIINRQKFEDLKI